MGKFDGILICTDLDGTMLKNDKTISSENIEAIEYFKREGGLFTFVTGRMPQYVDDILEQVKPNIPFGCVNGGGLYDSIKQEYIWKSVMPEKITELIKCIDEGFENIGILACTFEKTYFCKENITMKKFRERVNLENITCHYEQIKEPIAKIIFGSENEEEILKIKEVLDKNILSEQFDFIRSEKTLYEVLPKGISKGTSIKKLCENMNIDINRTIALGDYDNDISMFNAAKLGIAVSNACPEALKTADFVTVSNEENAVARVIYDLERGIYNI